MNPAKTILIIDDDARNIFALKAVLKSKGYNVISSTMAEDTLSLLTSHPNVGVVLLDMMMPDIDGYEVLGLLRTHPRFTTLPVIAVTAQAMPGDKEKCLDAGANDYISKPINTDLLIEYLTKYIGG